VQGAGTGSPVPALFARNVWKTYPGVQALRDINLDIRAGAIHGLVGENGSGKSTFVNLVSGAVVPDEGTQLDLFGTPIPVGSPLAAQLLGIAHVHQEPLIFPELTVLENVFVGSYPRQGVLTDARRMRAEFRNLLGQIGIDLNPRLPAGELAVADQTMVEIMRALRHNVRLLILDEPTASLGPPERDRLYSLIHRLNSERQITVIYISHDLDEILQLPTEITVFRDGEHVLTRSKGEMTKHRMVQAMLGEGVSKLAEAAEGGHARAAQRATVNTKPVLEVSQVTTPTVLEDVSLTVHEGEIVGIAGLVGAGRTSFLRALVGLDVHSSGNLRIDGEAHPWPRSIRQALRIGIALLPEDRKTDGLVLDMTTWDNVIQSDMRGVSRGWMIDNRTAKRRAHSLLQRVGFRGSITRPVRALSGGNQQKVLLSKWLHNPPRVFLLDEPTRGIDVGAKAEILETMRTLASDGASIVMVSSDFEEIVAACDRVVLMLRGRVIGELAGESISVANILGQLFEVEDVDREQRAVRHEH
jgi:ABC-type sugar transport system ATPase subunit